MTQQYYLLPPFSIQITSYPYFLHATSFHTLPYTSYRLNRDRRDLLAGGNGVVDSLVLLTGDLGLFVSSVPYELGRYE